MLRLVGHDRVERVEGGCRVSLLNLHDISAPALRAASVEQQSSLDREKPSSKRAVASKPVERRERTNERVLNQLLNVLTFSIRDGKASEGVRVSFHKPRSRSLIAALPPRDEVEITFVIAASRVSHPFKAVDACVLASLMAADAPCQTPVCRAEQMPAALPFAVAPGTIERQYTSA